MFDPSKVGVFDPPLQKEKPIAETTRAKNLGVSKMTQPEELGTAFEKASEVSEIVAMGVQGCVHANLSQLVEEQNLLHNPTMADRGLLSLLFKANYYTFKYENPST
ncbi:unnamed protein product, partial [Ilex paraguariensis]